MPIGIYAAHDYIVFQIENYFVNQAEYSHIEKTLTRYQLPFLKQENLSIQNNIDVEFRLKTADIYAKGINNLELFERTILSGLSKISSALPCLQPLSFRYLKTTGSPENSTAFHQENEALLKELDKDETDCMDWCLEENEIMKRFFIRSDNYLKKFFHEENQKRTEKCEEIYSSPDKYNSFLFFLPTELMVQVTNYIEPAKKNEVKGVPEIVKRRS